MEPEDEPDEWSDLDRVALRKNVHELIQEMPGDYESLIAAMQDFDHIAKSEMAIGLTSLINLVIERHPKSTRADARRLADRLNDDLASLGLCIEHPETGEQCRLSIAPTPAARDDQSWLQLEPLAGRMAPTRLATPTPMLRAVAASGPTDEPRRSPSR